MIETCAAFSLRSQSISVSGGNDDLTFSALRPRSGRHMKTLQFRTDFDAIIILGFYL